MAPQILLVSRDPTVAELLIEVISNETPGRVVHMPDCRAALAWLCAAGRSDLLLLDVGWPLDEELAFCATLADQAAWATIPLLVLADNPTKLPLAPRPGLALLGKPFDLPALLAMVVTHFPVPDIMA